MGGGKGQRGVCGPRKINAPLYILTAEGKFAGKKLAWGPASLRGQITLRVGPVGQAINISTGYLSSGWAQQLGIAWGPNDPGGRQTTFRGPAGPRGPITSGGPTTSVKKRSAIVSGRGKDPVPIPAAKITNRNGQKWKLHVGREETAPPTTTTTIQNCETAGTARSTATARV